MVTAYVWAGFSKIHLDASMGCAGEPAALDDETIATRAARLAKAAEKAARARGGALPVYIIGTEVPAPGGVDHAISELKPTQAAAARRTIEVHREIFAREGLADAFGRVIAVVVQPGVEFGSQNVVAYRPEASKALTALLDEEPSLVYEAHSTDYQSRAALTALVGNGFPILKVGPGLTFALREALYGLDLIASEMVADYGDRSLARAMERIMLVLSPVTPVQEMSTPWAASAALRRSATAASWARAAFSGNVNKKVERANFRRVERLIVIASSLRES